MMAMGDDVVKEKEMIPKRKSITIKFNGRVITSLISPTTWSAYMSQINNITDPNDSTHTTNFDVSKRMIQETYQSLDLDPVVVVKKQRQMVVPNPNSRVQSSSSISVATTSTDYISNESSQLPKMKMKMKTDPSVSTLTANHINPNFEVSKRKTTEIYTTTCQDYESKLQLSQTKLQQGYQASERAKKQRQIVALTDSEKPIPKSRSSQASRFKRKKLQRLYVNHKTRQF